MIQILRIGLTVTILAGALALVCADPAMAQGRHINKKALHRATWHNAPRQIQILDERPIIKDFREAPSSPQMIPLPPGPRGMQGGHRTGGAGAMGEGPGGGSSPIQLGGPGAAPYRTGQGGRQLPLPKSGFNRTPSNIPSGGMAPKRALPGGHTTNRLMGKMAPPKKGASGGLPRRMAAPRGRSVGNTPVANYGTNGGYGTGTGNARGGSASRTEALVRGSLLKKTK